MVSPDNLVISAMCGLHADQCLTEYEAHAAEIPELAGWRGVQIEVTP